MGVGEGTYGTYAYVPDVGLRMVSEYTVFCPNEEKNWKTLYIQVLFKLILSQNEQIFNSAKATYQEALAKSGFECELKYQQPTRSNNKNKNRSRNQTWFNPPFSQNVSTNVGAKFLKRI